jgi:integrase
VGMARTLHKLSDAYAKSDRLRAGRHSDGGGLYLNVSPTGAKSWLFMWTVVVAKVDGRKGQKRHEMGLGSYPAVSLADARAMANNHRQTVAAGGNPIAERDREAEPTFADATSLFLSSMEKSWRNEKHRSQWRSTLETYCAAINAKRVSTITTEDVLTVLNSIWREKPETASRVRGRIERVLDFCKARGWRDGDNPAMWRGHLKNVLPARSKLSRGHHSALPYQEVPLFLERVRAAEAMAARALEFTILCASRSGETYGAQWPEIDFDTGIWTVPKGRMKAGKEHRVPLSKQAVALLERLKETSGGKGYVFPGERKGKPLSNMAMAMFLKRLKVPVTVHGFRSSFRDWAGDATSFPREVAEAALAHSVGNAVEAAYRRSDALERRRKMMQAWADYLDSKKGRDAKGGAKVLAFPR